MPYSKKFLGVVAKIIFSACIAHYRVAITASGLNLGDTSMENLVEMEIDSHTWRSKGEYVPPTEYLFHTDIIMRLRPDLGAVLHIHPPHATTCAVLKRDIRVRTDPGFNGLKCHVFPLHRLAQRSWPGLLI